MLLYSILCRFIPKKMLAFAILLHVGQDGMGTTCGELFGVLTEEMDEEKQGMNKLSVFCILSIPTIMLLYVIVCTQALPIAVIAFFGILILVTILDWALNQFQVKL